MPTFNRLGSFPYESSFELLPRQINVGEPSTSFVVSFSAYITDEFQQPSDVSQFEVRYATSLDNITYSDWVQVPLTQIDDVPLLRAYSAFIASGSTYVKWKITLLALTSFSPRPSIIVAEMMYTMSMLLDAVDSVIQSSASHTFYYTSNTTVQQSIFDTKEVPLASIASSFITAFIHSTVDTSLYTAVVTKIQNPSYQYNQPSREIKGKCTILFSDIKLDDTLSITSNQIGRGTNYADLIDGREMSPFKWWTVGVSSLNSDCHPLPATGEFSVGLWGTSISDNNGVLPEPLVVTLNCSKRFMENMDVVGDLKENNFPIDFTLTFYEDTEVITTVVVTGNDKPKYAYSNIASVTKVILTVTKISVPFTVAKLTEYYSVIKRTYEDADLVSISLLEEIGYDTGSVPIGNISMNEIDVVINNTDRLFDLYNTQSPLYGYLKKNRVVTPLIGIKTETNVHWSKLGTFWVTSWDVPRNSMQVSLTARDRLSLLQQSAYNRSALYENKSVGFMFETILLDSGLKSDEFYIDSTLYSVVIPFMWFIRGSHFDALRRLAAACLCHVYCDRNGAIVVKSTRTTIAKQEVFSDSNVFEMTYPLEWSEITNRVEITSKPLRKSHKKELANTLEVIDVKAGVERITEIIADVSPVTDLEISNVESATQDVYVTIQGVRSPSSLEHDKDFVVSVKVKNTGKMLIKASDLKMHVSGDYSYVIDCLGVDLAPNDTYIFTANLKTPSVGPQSSMLFTTHYLGNPIGEVFDASFNLSVAASNDGFLYESSIAANVPVGNYSFNITAVNTGIQKWTRQNNYGLLVVIKDGPTVIKSFNVLLDDGVIVSPSEEYTFYVSTEVPAFSPTAYFELQLIDTASGTFGRKHVQKVYKRHVSCSITDVFAWGAKVRITSDADETITCLTIAGKTLEAVGSTMIVKEDISSVQLNGVFVEQYQHDFIQEADYASELCSSLLLMYSRSRYDAKVIGRGNAALAIGHGVEDIDGNKYTVKRQHMHYEGSLEAELYLIAE